MLRSVVRNDIFPYIVQYMRCFIRTLCLCVFMGRDSVGGEGWESFPSYRMDSLFVLYFLFLFLFVFLYFFECALHCKRLLLYSHFMFYFVCFSIYIFISFFAFFPLFFCLFCCIIYFAVFRRISCKYRERKWKKTSQLKLQYIFRQQTKILKKEPKK